MNGPDHSSQHVLFIETYPTGSHGRVIDLLARHSRHTITDIRLNRAHWKWLAIAAHHDVMDVLNRLSMETVPDVLVLSGPLNAAGLVSRLPSSMRDIPRIIYFHESQWTYPSLEADPRPYVLQHLDAIEVCDEAWFNSAYHLDVFWAAATSPHADDRVRRLARQLRPKLKPRCRVVYPPVSLDAQQCSDNSPCDRPCLLWNARWELDKRPDRFIKLLDRLEDAGVSLATLILGTGSTDPNAVLYQLGRHAAQARVPGHLEDREAYEAMLTQADVFVSTAEHEFFGVAALEASLAGVMPLVPNALAYPETMPSAFFYRPHDIEHAFEIAQALLTHPIRATAAQISDASRFTIERTVPHWDEHIQRVASRRRD